MIALRGAFLFAFESGAPATLAEVVVPHARHVAKHPEGHEGVRGALVLDKEVDQDFFVRAQQAGGEQEIAVEPAQAGVDEAHRLAGERIPAEPLGQRGWENGPQ
jgi:hypothetical protein